MKIYFLTILSIIFLPTALSEVRSGKAICEAIGTNIFDGRLSKVDTILDYVAFNTPAHENRLIIIENKFPTPLAYINHFINYLYRVKMPFESQVKKIVYQDTKNIFTFYRHERFLLRLISKPIDEIIKISEPLSKKNEHHKGNQLISSTWVDVFSDKRYVMPLLMLVKKLHLNLYSNQISQKNVFTDLVDTFLEIENVSHTDAKKMAWNILGLYGSRGASLGWFSLPYDLSNSGLGYALAYFAYLISATDTLNLKNNGRLYSIPEKFITECAIGKPYHFWMSAFLAYKLKEKNISTIDAINAPFSLAQIYEYYLETNGRKMGDANRSFHLLEEEIDSLELNSIRLGHILHAAGAAYGAGLKNKSKNLDNILLLSIQKSKKPKYKHRAPVSYLYLHKNLKALTASDFIFESIVNF